jgi:hypothetical protein
VRDEGEGGSVDERAVGEGVQEDSAWAARHAPLPRPKASQKQKKRCRGARRKGGQKCGAEDRRCVETR